MLTAHLFGRHISELDTPALCVELPLLDANIAAMAELLAAHGKQWRPHIKCHKSPAIAHRQLQAGAIGVTAAKVSEAEVFIDAGVPDVLIANMIVGEPKLERLAGLCRRGDPIVAIDHFVQAEALAGVCRRRGVVCRVVVEINLGLNRVGVRPGSDARDLCRGVATLDGVQFVGVMGYEGHLLTLPEPEKQERLTAAMALLEEIHDACCADGLPCGIVSAGGTGSYQSTARLPGPTEVQAGGGVFADPFYLERCGVRGLQPALRLAATVVSRGKRERAVLDCGRKSLHPDTHAPTILGTAQGRPLPDASITQFSAEHTTLELGTESQDLRIGDKVLLIPGYSDHTTPLHPVLYGLHEGRVAAVWPTAARGMIA